MLGLTQERAASTAAAITNLRLKFPGEASLLFKDLSFSIAAGEKVLLLGPSGCGKSTLLQVLSGIMPGSVEVPLKYERRQLPDSWGFVFQDPDTQFCMPYVDEELAFVLENLSVPREQMEPRMISILERVGLRLDELHTPIAALSQGMKQRLALASVLLLEPEVLFLDEPSALLDPEGTQQIWETVKDIAGSHTLLIVEHKLELVADIVDRVVLFDSEGRIMADGEPGAIFTMHKEKLIEYGIWYPDVWRDHVKSEAYRAIVSAKRRQRQTEAASALRAEPIIALRGFSGYRGEAEAIAVEAADVYPGEWIAVTGPNGAGKSTLLLSLMRLLHTNGSYIIEGRPVPEPKQRGWFRKARQEPPDELAFVFQNPEMQFLTDSVYEELAYGLRLAEWSDAEIERQVTALMAAFDLDMGAGRHPYHLSLGQKRRLSVATAVVREHPVLLLDEPTFGQDARNTFAILDKLERLRAGGTAIVMVTHDLNIVRHYADRVWQVEMGRLTVLDTSREREAQLT
ncbi:ABC transporter ATP-binding protein [Paenibacillus thiaminolyticus]|uniref:ABC transporter ATP-binding protein n=1 Tax=Paenibacillus thiaminolyticus TaxID=49283 RepID=UPI0030B93EC3